MRLRDALAVAALSTAAPCLAQETALASLAPEMTAIAGCWKGTGAVMKKPVAITLSAKRIVEGALFLIEADSHATADPADRYAAHLIFGAKGAASTGKPADGISGLWADSFGGDFTATGIGAVRAGGFDITYAYPDADFINRWRVTGDRLSWVIVAKSGGKPEAAFASYDLVRTGCPAG